MDYELDLSTCARTPTRPSHRSSRQLFLEGIYVPSFQVSPWCGLRIRWMQREVVFHHHPLLGDTLASRCTFRLLRGPDYRGGFIRAEYIGLFRSPDLPTFTPFTCQDRFIGYKNPQDSLSAILPWSRAYLITEHHYPSGGHKPQRLVSLS